MKTGKTNPGAPFPMAESATKNHAPMKYNRDSRRSPRLSQSNAPPTIAHTIAMCHGSVLKRRVTPFRTYVNTVVTGEPSLQASLPGSPQLPPPEPEKKASPCQRKPGEAPPICSVRLRDKR